MADNTAGQSRTTPGSTRATRPGATAAKAPIKPPMGTPAAPGGRADGRDRGATAAGQTAGPVVRGRRQARGIVAGKARDQVARVPVTTAAMDRTGDRIAKLLARAGVASRREVERMIAEGRIAKDGVAIDTPATLLTSLHGITVDGVPVRQPSPARLFLFHKPVGALTTERDPRGRKTIYDILPGDLPRVMPVGRLDMNTEGLLLLTTDGELKRQLELPSSGVERTYRARAYGKVTQPQLEQLMLGTDIDGVRYGPINANMERRTGANGWIEMTLTEGKNREVRRVLEHLGLTVSRLIRTSYGPFKLADLPAGGVVEVRRHDLVVFRQTLDRQIKGRAADRDQAGS